MGLVKDDLYLVPITFYSNHIPINFHQILLVTCTLRGNLLWHVNLLAHTSLGHGREPEHPE